MQVFGQWNDYYSAEVGMDFLFSQELRGTHYEKPQFSPIRVVFLQSRGYASNGSSTENPPYIEPSSFTQPRYRNSAFREPKNSASFG